MLIKHALQRYIRGEDGAIAVLFALFAVVLIGAMAISIDVGAWYLAQKKLQTEADLAATSAALSLDPLALDPSSSARAAAERTAVGNGLDGSAVKDIEPKQFLFDKSVTIDSRLRSTPTGGIHNAVTTRLERDTPIYFASLFLPNDHLTLTAVATAAKADYAAFTLGSRLAQLHDRGAVNGLLKAALGSNVDLKLLDYDALLGAQVNLLEFTGALATQVNLQAADYSDLLDTSITTPQLLNAIISALPDTPDGRSAATSLSSIVSSVARDALEIRKIIAIEDELTDLNVNDILEPIHISALDILMASVDIINAQNHRIVELPLSLSIPNLAKITVKILVGEKRAGSGWVTLGSAGASLHTAQVRLKINLEIGVGITDQIKNDNRIKSPIKLTVQLPIYMEIASGTVTLTELNCRTVSGEDVVASFRTGNNPFQIHQSEWSANQQYINNNNIRNGTAIATLYIGKFGENVFFDMAKPTSIKNLEKANLLTAEVLGFIELLTFDIRGAIYVGDSKVQLVSFKKSEISTGNTTIVKTIGSNLALTSLVAQLLNKDNLEITTPNNGLLSGIITGLLSALAGVFNVLKVIVPNDLIGLLLSPVSSLLDALLDLLGIGIGEMDLALHGVSCGNVTLVR